MTILHENTLLIITAAADNRITLDLSIVVVVVVVVVLWIFIDE
jgi:hypothetical protein